MPTRLGVLDCADGGRTNELMLVLLADGRGGSGGRGKAVMMIHAGSIISPSL
jgi:hypothetical protein